MNRELKIDDEVIWINKEFSDWWEETNGVSLYGKSAKIIYIEEYNDDLPYLLEFKEWIGEHAGYGYGKGRDGYCKWCTKEDFKLKKGVKMNREFKVGDEVIYIDKEDSNSWKRCRGISLYGKIAKIIDISDNYYLLEFKELINGHDGGKVFANIKGKIKGKYGHCIWVTREDIKIKKSSNQKTKMICTIKIKKGDEIIYKKKIKKDIKDLSKLKNKKLKITLLDK